MRNSERKVNFILIKIHQRWWWLNAHTKDVNSLKKSYDSTRCTKHIILLTNSSLAKYGFPGRMMSWPEIKAELKNWMLWTVCWEMTDILRLYEIQTQTTSIDQPIFLQLVLKRLKFERRLTLVVESYLRLKRSDAGEDCRCREKVRIWY